MTAICVRLAVLVAATAVAGLPAARSAEYTLMPSPQTVHIGHFSAALKPVLTINSGDIVTIETATSLDPVEVDQSGAVPPSVVPEYQRAIHREVKDRGPSGHVLTGPIFVNGAQPRPHTGGSRPGDRSCGRVWLQPSAALHGRAAG